MKASSFEATSIISNILIEQMAQPTHKNEHKINCATTFLNVGSKIFACEFESYSKFHGGAQNRIRKLVK